MPLDRTGEDGPDRPARRHHDRDRGGRSEGPDRMARTRRVVSMESSGSTEEGARARRIELGGQRQIGLDRLDLEEAPQPARWQRNAPLDDRPAVRLELDGVAAHGQAQLAPVLHARQRRSETRPEVDVRRSPPERFAVIRLGQEVDAAVDAAACRERLEPQPVVGAGRDGSARSRMRVSIRAGTWKRERATSPRVSSRSAATTGRRRRPRKN